MIDNTKPYIIGETAFHHQGDICYLKNLIKAASELKLDAIKLHLLFDISDYFVESHPAIEVINQWTFTKLQWEEIIQYAYDFNLDLVLLCNDLASLEWVNAECKTPIKAIELHATGINDLFLLNSASQFAHTVILGIGGSKLDQIEVAIETLRKLGKTDIFLMYGFQSYPTDYNDINLSKISLMKELFKLPVGYTDHTNPLDPYNEFISVSGILKGANVIEKHFTLDVNEKRIDSQSAVSIDQMKKIKELSSIMFATNGEGGLRMSEAELKYGDIGPMKKAIVARRNISLGSKIIMEDLAYKRTEQSSYLEQEDLLTLIGSKALINIDKDDIINFNNVQYNFKITETTQFLYNK